MTRFEAADSSVRAPQRRAEKQTAAVSAVHVLFAQSSLPPLGELQSSPWAASMRCGASKKEVSELKLA